MTNLIINFAPTSMIPTKEMTPHVPVSTKENIDQVLGASELSISMVYLNAREKDSGEPTYKKEIYAEIIAGIRKYNPELVISASLSGGNFGEFAQKSDPLLLEAPPKTRHGKFNSYLFKF